MRRWNRFFNLYGFAALAIFLIASAIYSPAALAACEGQPMLVSPSNGAILTNTSPTFTISLPPMAAACLHVATEWQFANDPNFATVWNDTGFSTNNKTSYSLGGGSLAFGQTYYWRVRIRIKYILQTFESAWSGPNSFSVSIASKVPIIPVPPPCNWLPVFAAEPADGATIKTTTPTLKITGGLFIPGTHCEQTATDWVIMVSAPNDLPLPAYDSLADAVHKTALTVPDGELTVGLTYWWQARRRGPAGASDWSEWSKFTIESLFPEIKLACYWKSHNNHTPADSETNVSLTPLLSLAKSGQPALPPECKHGESQWQIATDSNFGNIVYDSGFDNANLTSLIVPQNILQPGTLYHWRVRMKNGNVSISSWSQPTTFTTAGGGDPQQPPPQPPQNPPPANGGNDAKDYDLNANCALEDSEFFKAIDDWIAQAIDNALFFSLVDAWIGQENVCALASSAMPEGVTLSVNRATGAVTFAAQSLGISSLSVEVFSPVGERVFRRETSGSRLTWRAGTAAGRPAANGVYLYRVLVHGSNGEVIKSGVRKLLILR